MDNYTHRYNTFLEIIWIIVDRVVFKKLHAGQSIHVDEHVPLFARGTSRGGAEKRRLGEWFLAWLGREILALPVWTWAVFLGASLDWRGKQFRVRSDMTVVAIDAKSKGQTTHQNGRGGCVSTRGKID